MRRPRARRARMWLRRTRARLLPGAAILGYHSISEGDDPLGLAVSPARFAEHLEVLARRTRPMRLDALTRALRDRRVPPRAVVVTFDDGYADLLHAAAPLLERHDVPATAFVTTGSPGQVFPWDARTASAPARLQDNAPGSGRSDGSAPMTRRALTIAELATLAGKEWIEVGAHTISHPRLADLEPEAQRREIQGGKAALEEVLGRRVESFSDPHGSVGRKTVTLVRQAGYERACTSVFDVAHAGSDRWRLPRIWPRDGDGDVFARWLDGWLPPR